MVLYPGDRDRRRRYPCACPTVGFRKVQLVHPISLSGCGFSAKGRRPPCPGPSHLDVGGMPKRLPSTRRLLERRFTRARPAATTEAADPCNLLSAAPDLKR